MKNRSPVARHLQQLTHERAQSFALPLLDRTGPLSCDRLLQLTPGKRASFHGFYFNDEVVAKLYFQHGKHADFAQQEIDGLRALQNAGCITPAFLYAGLSSDQAASVVLLKWLPDARTVFGLWPELTDSDPEREQIVLSLADYLARQHMAGLQLREPHLTQYMWHQQRILGIDGGRVRKHKSPLSFEQGMLALAQLWAQFAPRWDDLLLSGLEHYLQQRYGMLAEAFRKKTVLFWRLLFQFRQQRVAQRWQIHQQRLKTALAASNDGTLQFQSGTGEGFTLELPVQRTLLGRDKTLLPWLSWQACLPELEIPVSPIMSCAYPAEKSGLVCIQLQASDPVALFETDVQSGLPLLQERIVQLAKLGIATRACRANWWRVESAHPDRQLINHGAQHYRLYSQWQSARRAWQKQLKSWARSEAVSAPWREALSQLAAKPVELAPAKREPHH